MRGNHYSFIALVCTIFEGCASEMRTYYDYFIYFFPFTM